MQLDPERGGYLFREATKMVKSGQKLEKVVKKVVKKMVKFALLKNKRCAKDGLKDGQI